MNTKPIRASILLGLAFVLHSIPSHGQTLFQVPDVAVRYEEYRYFDECDAAVQRLLSESKNSGELWLDTAYFDAATLTDSIPHEVAAAARICIKKVDVDTIRKETFLPFASLLLYAGRDEDAKRLFTRIYNGTDQPQKVPLLLGLMKLYGQRTPLRLGAMKELYAMATAQNPEGVDEVNLVESAALLTWSSYISGDTSFSRQLGSETVRRYAKLSKEANNDTDLRRALSALGGFPVGVTTYRIANESSLLDSLSTNMEAYRSYSINRLLALGFDSSWSVEAYNPDKQRDFLFRNIPPLLSNIRFQALDHKNSAGLGQYRKVPQAESYDIPRKGTVNLIVFLTGGCHRSRDRGYLAKDAIRSNGWRNCTSVLAALRRLKLKFPAVELSVSVRTFGNVALSVPLTPNQEADTLAKYFLGFHKLDGNLLVRYGEWIRLPGNPYDGRRIDMPDPQDSLFDNNPLGWLFAVDQDGVAWKNIRVGGWKVSDELELEQEIRAVLKRKARID